MTDDTVTAALRKIATYNIPIVKIARGEYVALGHVTYLRELARRALGLPRTDPSDKVKT